MTTSIDDSAGAVTRPNCNGQGGSGDFVFVFDIGTGDQVKAWKVPIFVIFAVFPQLGQYLRPTICPFEKEN